MFQTQCYQRLSRVIVYLPSNDVFQDQITLRKCVVNAVDVTKNYCEKKPRKDRKESRNEKQCRAKKTKFMLIGSAHNLSAKGNEVTNSIIMNNSIIESVLSQKCLGVDLDNRLIFDIHIENLGKKICSGIGALRRIKPFVPLRSLKMLYKALIQPYFDYCSPLWDTCGKVHKEKLQVLQNRAARVITGARFDVNSANVLEDLQSPRSM